MNVLLLRPDPGNERFGLGPFFRVELEGQPWFKYDVHHVLWEPRLGAQRFFELYAETWRRSILNTRGEKKLTDWMRQVQPSQVPYITRVLLRTQRMMKASAYLDKHAATAALLPEIPADAIRAS